MRLLIISIILILGALLKFYNYDVYPQRGATSDEYTYSFLGVSLLTKGVPISWSHFDGYRNREDLAIKGIYFPIVWPYFDHPPLNGLIVGAWSLLWGGDTFERIQLSVIRVVPIVLSTLSTLFVYLIARRRYGFRVGLWALLIYSTATIMVIHSRVVLAENLLTPLMLFALYFYDVKHKRIQSIHALALGIFAGLSFWTKEAGVSVFFILMALMIMDRIRRSLIINFILVSILIMAGYIWYGMYFDASVFWSIMTTQATRDIGPKTLQYLLTTPIIVNKVYHDGWYFLGFLSLFAGLSQAKNLRIILVPAFTYFILLLVILTQEAQMGWYLIPLFPFMAIATAYLLVESVEQVNWYVIVLPLFVGFSHMEHIYQNNFGLTVSQFRLLSGVLFAPLAFTILSKNKRIFEKLGTFYFYSFVAGNIYLTYTYIHPA